MFFRYRNQPLKALYLLYATTSILFARMPYWIITSLVPSWRPRRSWSFVRSFMIQAGTAVSQIIYDVGLPEVYPKKRKPLADRLGQVWIEGLPSELISGEIAEAAHKNQVKPVSVAGYWIGKRNEAGEYAYPASPGEKVLYYFHGGGYVLGTAAPDDFASMPARTILEHSSLMIDRAFGVEYRLCASAPFTPANPFPAALLDALGGYHYLTANLGFKPENIILAGDSAGGHLAFILTRYLVSSNISSMPPPAGVILLAPTVDWAGTHDDDPNSSMWRNARTDLVYTVLKSGYTGRGLLGSLPESELYSSPWLSPASLRISGTGLFKHFPPVIIITGSLEQTLDPVRTLRERLVRDNGEDIVKYIEYPEATHDFLMFTWHEPERTQAAEEIRGWMERIFRKD